MRRVDLAGETIGVYRVVDFAGRGGSSIVYRVIHVAHGGELAIKVLDRELVGIPELVAQFRREAALLDRVRHPGIVRFHEHGALPDGRPYTVMEWLDGLSLQQHLNLRGRLGIGEAVATIVELCAAVAALHAIGIVHCDLKPANVVMVHAGLRSSPRLIDFGIARSAGTPSLIGDGVVAGTPSNMAPEQILGAAVEPSCDVYALGILLFELLTGHLPFVAAEAADLAALHVHATPPRASQYLDVPTALDAVVARCLSKNPLDRFADAAELALAAQQSLCTTSPIVRSAKRHASRSS